MQLPRTPSIQLMQLAYKSVVVLFMMCFVQGLPCQYGCFTAWKAFCAAATVSFRSKPKCCKTYLAFCCKTGGHITCQGPLSTWLRARPPQCCKHGSHSSDSGIPESCRALGSLKPPPAMPQPRDPLSSCDSRLPPLQRVVTLPGISLCGISLNRAYKQTLSMLAAQRQG